MPVASTTPIPEKKPAGPQWSVNVHKLALTGAAFDFWDDP
jgi:hypothetical protein